MRSCRFYRPLSPKFLSNCILRGNVFTHSYVLKVYRTNMCGSSSQSVFILLYWENENLHSFRTVLFERLEGRKNLFVKTQNVVFKIPVICNFNYCNCDINGHWFFSEPLFSKKKLITWCTSKLSTFVTTHDAKFPILL